MDTFVDAQRAFCCRCPSAGPVRWSGVSEVYLLKTEETAERLGSINESLKGVIGRLTSLLITASTAEVGEAHRTLIETANCVDNLIGELLDGKPSRPPDLTDDQRTDMLFSKWDTLLRKLGDE